MSAKSESRSGARQKLPPQAQLWAVSRLACFAPAATVLKELREGWDVEITPQALSYYDPTTAAGQQLRPELKEHFERTRARYLEDAQAAPIAHQGFRLQELMRLYLKHREGNPAVAADLLSQAAKESGGAFTNRRELTGKDGGPIQTEHRPDLTKLSDEELDLLERLLLKSSPNPG